MSFIKKKILFNKSITNTQDLCVFIINIYHSSKYLFIYLFKKFICIFGTSLY